MEIRGPQSFAVAGNGDIYILDTIDGQIEIFNNKGKQENTIKLPEDKEFFDIEFGKNNNVFVINDLGEINEYKNGKLKNTFEVSTDEGILGLFQDSKQNVVVRYLDGTETIVGNKNKNKSYKGKRKNKSIELQLDSETITVDYKYEPAGTYPLQKTESGEQLVIENEALLGEGLYVETRVESFKNGKSQGNTVALPTINYYTSVPKQFIYATKDGKVYQMVPQNNSVDIYELQISEGHKTNINKALVEKYNPMKPNKRKALIADWYTAYQRAGDMINLTWTFDPSKNKTPDTSTLTPPQHLASITSVSSQTGIPYNWGGYVGIDTSSSPSNWSIFRMGFPKGNTQVILIQMQAGFLEQWELIVADLSHPRIN